MEVIRVVREWVAAASAEDIGFDILGLYERRWVVKGGMG